MISFHLDMMTLWHVRLGHLLPPFPQGRTRNDACIDVTSADVSLPSPDGGEVLSFSVCTSVIMGFFPLARIAVSIKSSVPMSAILMLELEAGVADAEFFPQPHLDRALDIFNPPPRLGFHDHMAVQRGFVLLHLPKMDLVHIIDALHVPHRFDDGLAVDVRRAAEHQCSDRAADLGEGKVKNVERDCDVMAGSTKRMS